MKWPIADTVSRYEGLWNVQSTTRSTVYSDYKRRPYTEHCLHVHYYTVTHTRVGEIYPTQKDASNMTTT